MRGLAFAGLLVLSTTAILAHDIQGSDNGILRSQSFDPTYSVSSLLRKWGLSSDARLVVTTGMPAAEQARMQRCIE